MFVTSDLDKVEIQEIEKLIRLTWEQKSSKKPLPQVAKISAVK